MKGCKVGKGLKCDSWPKFAYKPKGNITIGDHVDLGWNNSFEITPQGELVLGDHVLFGHHIWITCAEKITIGNYSAVAESASIRDAFHEMGKDTYYRKQPIKKKAIHIGEDCGVGAGARVLLGSKLPDGVFVGANAVVTEHDDLQPYGIYAGSPLKLVKERT